MAEAKTIYVVTDGTYSSYSITGVFDDQALAEKFRLHFGYDRVEEYDLNPGAPQLRAGLQAYEVRMARDGWVLHMERCSHVPDDEVHFWTNDPCMCTEMWATDEKHAVKIANERRVQLIANNEWRPRLSQTESVSPQLLEDIALAKERLAKKGLVL